MFPTSSCIHFRDKTDNMRARSQRHHMVTLEQFTTDPRSLNRLMVPLVKSLESRILPGATTIGISVTNFKTMGVIRKQQPQKLKCFFQTVDKGDQN